MIIKEISIQNFKSFGNNKQTIKFNKDAQLILIQGVNGSGKSSLQETIDFTLFGVVRGKERKRIPQTDLPNRINGSLLTSIKLINNNNQRIKIERGLKPLKLNVNLDNKDITLDYKKYDQEKREELIGLNYELYKSFISMSLNDFTNFINLEPETKRKLLNKLFNLEELDRYFEISKEIIRNNKKNIDKIKIDILNNNDTIKNYNNTIKNINSNENNLDKNDIKEKILSKKSLFIELKENISELNKLISDINEDISNRQEVLNSKKHRLHKIELKIDDYENKIKIFEKGKCPTCNTILKNYQHNLDNFKEDKKILNKEKDDIFNDILNYKKESKSVFNEKNKNTTELKFVLNKFNEINLELKLLKNKYDNYNDNNKAILEIKKNIENLENKNIKLNKLLNDLNIKNEKYQKLNEIFSIQGIRKNIIENTIEPINKYLSEYLKELDSAFKVEIDNEFNANIYERYINKIHPETLSSGEARKINISLALSYLEIIRKIKNSNILFLDEIFANVDSDNIDILLKTLKNFSKKYNINIIVISQDHTPFNIKLFDRIITLEKNTFTLIKDEIY